MKRAISLILTAAMVMSFLCTGAFAASFIDIEGHWAEEAIERWTSNGVVNGKGENRFDPDATLTRAEMAQIYVNLLNLTEKADISTYTDVPADAWYADAVAKCVAAGVLTGTGSGTFSPLRPITREQMFVAFGRAMGLKPSETTSSDLSDLSDVSDWAEGMVNALLNAGYVSGVGGNTLQPLNDINRASVMALLDKTVAAYGNTPGATVETEGDGGLVLVVTDDVTITGTVEDVVVAQGAADSVVTLSDATVTGTVTMAAAGARLAVMGESEVENVVVNPSAQGAGVSVGQDAVVASVVTEATDTDLSVSGTVGDVTVAETASSTTVSTEKGAKVESVTTAGADTTMSVAGTVGSVTVTESATGAAVNTEKGSKVDSVITAGSGTTVSGSGTVSKVEAAQGATDTKVETSGTKVENNSSESVTTDKGTVAAGESGTTSGGTSSGGSSGGGGGSSGGGSSAPSATAVNNVTAAILADTRTDGKVETLATNYTVTAQKWSNKDYVDVTVAATDLAYHQNGNNAMGYWIGFAVTAPEGAAKMRCAFADSRDALTLSEATALEANVTSNGKSGVAFYANLGGTTKEWAQVQWLGENDAVLSTETYKMDLTGVSLKGVTTEAELRSALSDSSMATVKLANDITVTSQIEVNRAVTIDGDNHEINIDTATSWSDVNGHKNLMCVHADNVTIKNVTLESQNTSGTELAYGLQGYKVTGMVLENVTIQNSKGTGLTVNGSSVTASNLAISGSVWDQSIDVSKGQNVDDAASLTLDNVDGLSDTNKIIEDKTYTAVVTVGGTRWYANGVLINDSKNKNSYIKYVYASGGNPNQWTAAITGELQKDFTVPTGTTLTILANVTLTVNGTLSIAEGGSLKGTNTAAVNDGAASLAVAAGGSVTISGTAGGGLQIDISGTTGSVASTGNWKLTSGIAMKAAPMTALKTSDVSTTITVYADGKLQQGTDGTIYNDYVWIGQGGALVPASGDANYVVVSFSGGRLISELHGSVSSGRDFSIFSIEDIKVTNGSTFTLDHQAQYWGKDKDQLNGTGGKITVDAGGTLKLNATPATYGNNGTISIVGANETSTLVIGENASLDGKDTGTYTWNNNSWADSASAPSGGTEGSPDAGGADPAE